MFWTKQHVYLLIPTFIISIIAAIIIAIALKNKDDKTKKIPLQVVTIVLLVLELWKQIRGFIVGYDNYWIPLHFCSLIIYTLPFAAFARGKYEDALMVLAGTVLSCIFLFMVIYPNIVFSDESVRCWAKSITFREGGNFSSFHSVTYHCIAVFAYILLVIQGFCKFATKRDLKWIMIFMAVYCVFVGTLSQVIKTNFNNFYHSNAPFLEDFRLKLIDSLGYGGQIIYVLMIAVGTMIVPLIAYLVLRGMTKLTNKFILKK